MVKRLEVFDFDGTIYDGDSMRDFACFLNRRNYYLTLAIIAIPYGLSIIRIISKQRVKRLFMKRCFGGKTEQELLKAGREFFTRYHAHLLPSAKSYIAARLEEGAHCIVVSASCREWLLPFCEAFGMELFCTQLEYAPDGTATGNWIGREVKGLEKVAVIRSKVQLSEYDEINAFGDSRADKALKAIAHSYYHCYFSR